MYDDYEMSKYKCSVCGTCMTLRKEILVKVSIQAHRSKNFLQAGSAQNARCRKANLKLWIK